MVESAKLSSRLLRARTSSRSDQQTAYRRCNSDPALTGKLVAAPITSEQRQTLRKCVPIVPPSSRPSVGNMITSRLKRVFHTSASSMRHSMIDETSTPIGTPNGAMVMSANRLQPPPNVECPIEGRLSFTSTSTGYSSARSSVRSSAEHTHNVVESSGSGSPQSDVDPTTTVRALLRLEDSRSMGTRRQLTSGGREPNYLHRIAMELLDTERAYVNDMHYVVEGYLNPILRDRQHLCVTTLDISNLFGCIERVLLFNRQLYMALDAANYHLPAMADAFVLLDEGFAVYDDFCTLYPKMAQSLERLTQQETVVAFLEQCQGHLQHHLPLGTYLLKPIQRVLKYHLFLQNALDHWPKHTEQLNRLRAALECMTARAQHINEVKRREEHSRRVDELQRLLTTKESERRTCDLLSDYGELVLEATFKLAATKHQSRRVLLFDEVLLVCKAKPDDTLVCKDFVLCSDLVLYKTLTGTPLAFRVASLEHKVQYSFVAATDDQRRQWVDELARLVRLFTPTPLKDKHRFVKGPTTISPKLSGPSRVRKYLSKRRKSSDGPETRRLSLVGNGVEGIHVDRPMATPLGMTHGDCLRSVGHADTRSDNSGVHLELVASTESHRQCAVHVTDSGLATGSTVRDGRATNAAESVANVGAGDSRALDRDARARHGVHHGAGYGRRWRSMPTSLQLPTRRHYGDRGRASTSHVVAEAPADDIETNFAELWHDLHMFAAENHTTGESSTSRATRQFPLELRAQHEQPHYANTVKPRMPPPKAPRCTKSSPRSDVPHQFLAAEQRLQALVERKNANRNTSSTSSSAIGAGGRLPVVRVLSGVRHSTEEWSGGYTSEEGDYDYSMPPAAHLGVVKNMVKQWQTENV